MGRRILVDVAMGAIVGLISYSQALQIAVVIGLTVLTGAVCVVVGVLLDWWSESMPAAIEIRSDGFLESSYKFEGTEILANHYLPLTIINKEHSDLVGFSAVLAETSYGSHQMPVSLTTNTKPFIGWRGITENVVDIPAHGGEHTLYVYRISTRQDTKSKDRTFTANSFNRVGPAPIPILLSKGHQLISFTLEFRATLNNKPVRAKDFYGYIDLNIDEGASGSFSIRQGKPSKEEIAHVNKERIIGQIK